MPALAPSPRSTHSPTRRDKGLRLGLVSAFPPGTRPLSEYGWHLVQALGASSRVGRLWVFSDRELGAPATDDGRTAVVPTWTFGSPLLAAAVIRRAIGLDLDALWFNVHMTSAGNTRASWFGGLCAPAVARLAGHRVLVTLHNLIGATDPTQAGVRASWPAVLAAQTAVRTLRHAQRVAVLRPEYVDLLASHYGLSNAVYVPHGTLGTPSATVPCTDGRHVLAFGHFGTYKRLDVLVDAVTQLARAGFEVRLSIGGTDSRHSPGYLEDLRRRCASETAVRFLGYVLERDVPALFRSASVCVLPYATTPGMSGVAVLAAMYGVPMLAADIPEFRRLDREGLRMAFFNPRVSDDLALRLRALLVSNGDRQALAEANLAYSRPRTMARSVDMYLDLIASMQANAVDPDELPPNLSRRDCVCDTGAVSDQGR